MFQSLRNKLFWQYYVIMSFILAFLSLITYFGVNKILYRELDKRLATLADVMIDNNQWMNAHYPLSSSLSSPLNGETGIEWFDQNGYLIARQGLTNGKVPPKPGILTVKVDQNPQKRSYPIRTYTTRVSVDRSELSQPNLEGYLRLSQSIQSIEHIKRRILYFSILSVSLSLGLVGVAGLWLTQQAVKPIAENVQKLKQFTADASHELRTPLSSIRSCIELIHHHPERIHPKDARKLAVIANATEKMVHLTQDLLFLVRNEGKKTDNEANWSLVSLEEILTDLIELLEPLAQEKSISIDYALEIEGIILGNPEQISRLLTNIIGNAIKYTPEKGQISVILDKYQRYAVILVEDTGMGIKAENLPRVFDRFWRADEARHEGGTGLGLPIAMAIAQNHGGNISVTSKIDEGTCFRITLPLQSV